MVRWLVESETVHREDKELYEYAVYSLFLTVTPIVLILIIGSLLGKTIQGLIIIFPFMFIRKFSGGNSCQETKDVPVVFLCGIVSCCLASR